MRLLICSLLVLPLLGQSPLEKKPNAGDVSIKTEVSSTEQLRSLAEQGNIEAQYKLVVALGEKENATSAEKAEKIKWCRKAAEKGHAGAQRLLGEMYTTGSIGSMNDGEAVKWYKLAAEQGDVDAQICTGILYSTGGVGLRKMNSEVVVWLSLAEMYGAKLYPEVKVFRDTALNEIIKFDPKLVNLIKARILEIKNNIQKRKGASSNRP